MVTRRCASGWMVMCVVLAAPAAFGANLGAAVLPVSRAVQVGQTATAFATIVVTQGPAQGCSIAPTTAVPGEFFYQRTDANNVPIGAPNTPVNIATAQSFVIGFTPTASFAPTQVQFSFACSASSPAAVLPGVNTLLLSASDDPVTDMIAIARTPDGSGVLNIIGAGASGAFAFASVNVGVAGDLQVVPVVSGGDAVQVGACETNPATGQCINPTVPTTSPIDVHVEAMGTPTFSVFATPNGAVAPDFANKRIYLEFQQEGVIRGSSSVAMQTLPAISGRYQGTLSEAVSNCADPDDNIANIQFAFTLDLNQTSASTAVGGSGTGSVSVQGATVRNTATFTGTVSHTGAFSATGSTDTFINNVLDSQGTLAISGTIGAAGGLSATFSGQDTTGDTCVYSGTYNATRSG